ncbi:MAG: hypothetical protein ABS916_09880 [Carnobacterium sp.]|uniref:beta-sandwich lipoprotein n=1 Tax=Carnobacterium sp. TaxID=48221 RepID=UPI003315C004
MKKFKKWFLIMALSISLVALGACTDAEVASQSLSEDADNFKVQRKITFINTVSDEVLYTIEGQMSVNADQEDNQLEIMAKTGENEFQKHILGLSPTTVYIVEQVDWVQANQYQFKITIKPSALVPEFEVR